MFDREIFVSDIFLRLRFIGYVSCSKGKFLFSVYLR